MTETAEATLTRVASPDGTEIAVFVSGRGRPLVVVHGTTSDHTTWRLMLSLFERHVAVHAVDRRGRGDQHRAVGLASDRGGRRLALGQDVADDLLDEILDGDEPQHGALLVDDHGERHALGLELLQHGGRRHRLGHERHGPDELLDLRVAIEDGGGEHVADRQVPGQLVEVTVVDVGVGVEPRSAAAAASHDATNVVGACPPTVAGTDP